MADEINLTQVTDATVWVEAWERVTKENPSIPNDPETMLGWFANAISAGFDKGYSQALSDIQEGSKLPPWQMNSPSQPNSTSTKTGR